MRSLHYFHAFGALGRVETLHLDDTKPIGDIKALPLSTFLPSAEDCSALRDNYVILISRILVKHLAFLHPFSKCVPKQIEHIYSEAMAKKSSVVSECNIISTFIATWHEIHVCIGMIELILLI